MGRGKDLILGIDTGSRGAYVSIGMDGDVISGQVFKASHDGIDFKSYLSDLREMRGQIAMAYVEEVHAIFGASAGSTFMFGRNYQTAICGLEALNIPYKLVTPKEWQKLMFKDARIIKRKNSKRSDTKAMAKAVAEKVFSGEGFLLTTRSKKAHDGLVDAALIARYGLYKEKDLE